MRLRTSFSAKKALVAFLILFSLLLIGLAAGRNASRMVDYRDSHSNKTGNRGKDRLFDSRIAPHRKFAG